jgi:ribosomal protein S12 methylthiotransferase
MADRAAARIGSRVHVLVDEVLPDGSYLGRGEHQAPEVDGAIEVHSEQRLGVGDLVQAVVTGSDGVDLSAAVIDDLRPGPADRYAAMAGDAGER